MKMTAAGTKKEHLATLGLLFITIWAALQYVFLQNVPDTVSTFSFIFITNVVGLVILALARINKLRLITRRSLIKGLVLSVELIGFNTFLIIGARGMDSVVTSSLVSMYFVFVTPILLLLKKKVSFRNAVASVVAVIALLLMFDADMETLFSSLNVVFLLLADLFFAAYVITVSILGEDEDSSVLTLSQMLFTTVLSLAGWGIEAAVGITGFSFPSDHKFWISVIFMGVFIRALYGILQVSCQKYVKPVNASLIFSSEIIITLITNPLMSRLMGTPYTKVNVFQILGCVLFVIAVLVVDDTIMAKAGYNDMDVKTYIDEKGAKRTLSTVSRKITNTTLIISMMALTISTVICVLSISAIKKTAVGKSTELGSSAADISEDALTAQVEVELLTMATDKSYLAEEKLSAYIASARYVADSARALYDAPGDYPAREVMYPLPGNVGKWAMQRCLADKSVSYEDVSQENELLGNLESTLQSIVAHSENISTIYIGTATGLLISYDPFTGDTDIGVENYYDYRDSEWFTRGREAEDAFFTKAYQDSYGRGLVVTCVVPIHDSQGTFKACVCIDVLVHDINESMVSDNIVDPDTAVLIDEAGNIIAGADIGMDPFARTVTIFDDDCLEAIRSSADTLLKGDHGILRAKQGDDYVYVAYSTMPLVKWTLCIMSPVSYIVRPATEIRDNISDNTQAVASTVDESIRKVINSCLVLFAALILIITYFTGRVSNRIAMPLTILEEDVHQISQGNLDRRTNVDTDDEIGSLARAFNNMTESLQRYIEDIKEMTANEQRIASELSLATYIQESALPRNFEDFHRDEFSLYATMDPAKEVGGDFYDFFLIDDSHLALVIADVSGKGVPAALFMMISKSLLKSAAKTGVSPKEILSGVNNQLCENNAAEMFVTVWLGILDIPTGRMVCANAGHEFPAVRRSGGQFELFRDKHGLVLGAMEGIGYSEYEMELFPGDMVYVYTDGVAEATNAKEELYGTDRMLAALNGADIGSCQDILIGVRRDIDAFVSEAPQFDDITMLCIRYEGVG